MAGKKGGATIAEQPKSRQTKTTDQADHDASVSTTPAPMLPITVRIEKMFHDPGRNLRAIANANIGDFAVRGICILESDKGLFASMPSKSYQSADGKTKYSDVFFPVTKEARDQLTNALLSAYEQALQNQQSDAQTPAHANQTKTATQVVQVQQM